MNKNGFALVTPTFIGHLGYIKKYLESIMVFATGNSVPIYLTIEEINIPDLIKITEKYPKLDIRVLSFEKILLTFNISYKTDELLKQIGKFSYQTLKKLYTLLYIKEEKTLIIDSESMMVKKYDLNILFKKYFSQPFIAYSSLNDRSFVSEFTKNIVENVDFLLSDKSGNFFLENFVWFYEKRILKALCSEIGYPYEIVKKMNKHFKQNRDLFEIQLYSHYIFKNNIKYNYKIINTFDTLKEVLNTKQMKSYVNNYYSYYEGNCGFLERVANCVDKDNLHIVSKKLIEMNFNLIRSEIIYKNARNHIKFITQVSPVFLCASQDHCFGIQNNLFFKINLIFEIRKDLIKVKNSFIHFRLNFFTRLVKLFFKITVCFFYELFLLIINFIKF